MPVEYPNERVSRISMRTLAFADRFHCKKCRLDVAR